MQIGLDFDNTIVCYDQAIMQLAEELFDIPEDVPRTKLGLRDYLRKEDREYEWTAFQGELYGPGMHYAQPFEGAIETMKQLSAEGHRLTIVSHRSRWPYAGSRHDLHRAARKWVSEQLHPAGIFRNDDECVYFMETREAKLSKIAEINCRIFLDDLPEVLESPGFPSSTIGVQFRPNYEGEPVEGSLTITRWKQLISKVAGLN